MMLDNIIERLNNKINNPSVEGSAGQILITNGSGVRTWGNAPDITNADTIIVDGKEYTIRTGVQGEEGYLTIDEHNIYLGLDRISAYIGNKRVLEIYKGVDKIYSQSADSLLLYDSSWVNDITWVGNKFPRPQYTSRGSYSLSNANKPDGYMYLYTNVGSGSVVTHNSHVCTSTPIVVPTYVTSLNVSVYTTNTDSFGDMAFGLVAENTTTSYNTSKGGQMSASIFISNRTAQTKTLTLADSVKGQTLYPIINFRGDASMEYVPKLYVKKVWFE